MKTITIDRAVVEQALESIDWLRHHLIQHHGCLHMDPIASGIPTWLNKNEATLRDALAEPVQEPTVKESLQVPAEVAATLTTTDIAWLATCRLTKFWHELGQMRWEGADEGWDRAIEAVRSRLNDECQDVLDWKTKADQSQATAVQLLRKMQGEKE